MRVALLGSSGLLGSAFQEKFAGWPEWDVVTLSRSQSPHSASHVQFESLGEAINVTRSGHFDLAINCIALASHEGCEEDVETAYAVNAEFPGKLAAACAQAGVRLIHISTDAVFDGPHSEPFTELDIPLPLSAYGRSKLEGENQVLGEQPDALVVRTNFFSWSVSGRNGVLDFFLNALTQGREVPGFTDYVTSSIYAGDLANSLRDLVTLDYSGILHIVSTSAVSKFEFGNLVAEVFGLRADLIWESSLASQTALTHRAPDLSLSPALIESILLRSMPSTKEGLIRASEDSVAFKRYWAQT